MQCISCGFENMPGLAACARCRSALAPGDVDVEPPRASALRLRTRLARAYYPIAAVVAAVARVLRRRAPRIPESVSGRAVAWSIVPGLGHIRCLDRRTGWAVLSTWLCCLLLLLATYPSQWTGWWTAALAATHAVAVTLILAPILRYERLALRAAVGVLLFVCLCFGVYVQLGRLGANVAAPLVLPALTAGRAVQTGDGLLYEGPWLRREPFVRGDIVLYTLPRVWGHGWYIRAGLCVDRVVGVPGDRVELVSGRLLVNGVAPPVELAPLGDVVGMPDCQATLSEGSYAIFPSRLALTGVRQPRLDLTPVVVVRVDQISGRVLWRLQPWWRFGPVR